MTCLGGLSDVTDYSGNGITGKSSCGVDAVLCLLLFDCFVNDDEEETKGVMCMTDKNRLSEENETTEGREPGARCLL